MLHHSLYEQVINNALARELADIPEARKAFEPIDRMEELREFARKRR